MSKTQECRVIVKLPSLLLLLGYATAQQYLAVDWSKQIYGPDGPWNAVSVQVGGVKNETPIALQQVTVDLHPGSTWTSFIPTNVSCNSYGSVCGEGSSWMSDTDANGGEEFFIAFEPEFDDSNSGTEFKGRIAPQAMTLGGQTVYQADLVNFGRNWYNKSHVTYPNGVKAFPQLGVLALNAGPNQKAMAQSFPLSATNNTPGYFSAWIPAGSLYNQSVIPSYSYGLHYGSAALNYSGSLYLGGYDKGRVIGPYTTYSARNPVLIDITIGVETGDSPLPFHNKTGLLVAHEAKQIEVAISPQSPSFYLPSKTCEGLAKVLPIYYDQDTKYYLWNTSDSLYEQLVTSPSYLGFVFPPAPGASANVNIKIPFRLLNLTLTSPVVSSPIQYFPCQGTTPDADSGLKYALGRAFLQGAFVGWNTKTNLGWLAQAPGPGVSGLGLGVEGKNIEDDATELDVHDGSTHDYFAQSWANHWMPINPEKTSQSSNDATSDASVKDDQDHTSDNNDISLSTGVIVGITAGGALAAVLLTSGLIFCILKRRRQRKTVKASQSDRRNLWPKTPDDISMEPPQRSRTPPPPFTQYPNERYQEAYHHFAEMPGQREVQELHSSHRIELERREIQDSHLGHRFEMGRRSVYELGLPQTPRPQRS